MFVDARALAEAAVIEADLCIIGAGAAGITLARELARERWRVVVLETGGVDPDPDTLDLSHGEGAGLPYYPLAASRLRYFGGTTNHWGGLCRPFDEIDFEVRPGVPLSGWPITRAHLKPYEERARAICRIRSAEWDARYWLRRDRFPALPLETDRLVPRVVQAVPSEDRRFGTNYRADLEHSSNVTVYLNASLTELEANEGVSAVTLARAACLTGRRFAVRARLYVLAAGGIENARLLLLSRRQHSAGLGNQHDQVGRYFMEHPRFVGGILVPANPRLPTGFYGAHRVDGITIHGYLALSEAVRRAEGLLDVQIDLDSVYQQSFIDALEGEDNRSLRTLLRAYQDRTMPSDITLHVGNVLRDVTTWQDHAVAAWPVPLPHPSVFRDVWRADPSERLAFLTEVFGDVALAAYAERAGSLPIDHVEVKTRVEQVPNPDSRVTLAADRDALGLQRVQLEWHLTSLEKRSMVRALEIFGREVGRAGIGRLRMTVPEGDAWPEDTRGGWHHMGTTRMSDDPRTGVVDRDCRVHGLGNLFVAGSSVFATAGGATPTFTLICLALRLADRLEEELR